MKTLTSLDVLYAGRKVGTLAMADTCAAFEYDAAWLQDGFAISPLSLPLRAGVFIPSYLPFEGVFGVFSDSLPDGWGRLLLDRLLRSKGEDPALLDPLQRLAVVGSGGMGALEYRPSLQLEEASVVRDYDRLARECSKILNDEFSDDLDRLFHMGGSSGGARPKVLVDIDGEPWIVKFRSSSDPVNVGKMEYDYAVCAKSCGIEMPEVRLLHSEECPGYFAVKRFDRVGCGSGGSARLHVASASALLETTHRIPNLDYAQLMKLTTLVTGSYAELEKLYRLMCFNVFAHNRDDHSKNFAFLFDGQAGSWRFSPAFDLTYSNSIGGQHATTVDGNGSNPGVDDLLRVARAADIPSSWAYATAERIHAVVEERLSEYL